MIKTHERCGGVWGRLLAISGVPLALPFDSSQGKPDCGLSAAGPWGDFLQGDQRQHPGGSYCGYPSPAAGGFWARRRLAITTEVRIAQMTRDCQGLIWGDSEREKQRPTLCWTTHRMGDSQTLVGARGAPPGRVRVSLLQQSIR